MKKQFSNNLPKLSKAEAVEIMSIVLGAMLEMESIPGCEFPKSVSESSIDWFKAAGIWKSNYNGKSCIKSELTSIPKTQMTLTDISQISILKVTYAEECGLHSSDSK